MKLDRNRILQAVEIQEILAHLNGGRSSNNYSINTHANLIVFRLACCCGLRRAEICGIELRDFALTGQRPGIRIRKEITKSSRWGAAKSRLVPLWWDRGTLEDIARWHRLRSEMTGSNPKAPFLFRTIGKRKGDAIHPDLAARRWKTAVGCLGPDRRKQLSIHDGRHSFCSHALHAGRSLVEVRDAAGHSNISTTSIYLHAVDDDSGIGEMFAFDGATKV